MSVEQSLAVSDYLVGNPGIAKSSSGTSGADEARETAQQFEAILVQTMLKAMRKSTPGNALFGSDQADMYLDLFDKEIASSISQSGQLGIADAIYRQITPDQSGSGDGGKDGVAGAMGTVPAAMAVQARGAEVLDEKTAFKQRIFAEAERTADRLGTTPDAVVAIAALESAWGSRTARNTDGSSTYNLFGIKDAGRWDGPVGTSLTREFEAGEFVEQPARFRAYPSEQQSVRDFGEFIAVNPRYRNALDNASDPEMFIREIHKAGYATDPDYADKAIAILRELRD